MELGTNENNPYLSGLFAPIEDEITADNLKVHGELPRDLFGACFRNGPNPRFAPKGMHHWFDGDGMVHGIHFEDGKAHYRNRYIATQALAEDIENEGPRWKGLMECRDGNPGPYYKDTANTDLVFHNRELLATWYLSGAIHRLDPNSLKTLGALSLAGGPKKISAHPTVDEHTGELMFFDYDPMSPKMSYGVLATDGSVAHHVPIEIPGPRLPHDMAITERHSILMDLPVFLRPEAEKYNRWIVGYERDLPARFGVIPRFGRSDEIKWFEATPCYVYHAVNAWEDGDEVVLVGCRVDDPLPKPDPNEGKWSHLIANLQVRARLHCWRFNMKTLATNEFALDDRITEFPSINAQHTGRKTKYAYNMKLDTRRELLFEGIVKYDTESGASTTLDFGDGWYGSESPFASRVGGKTEDDGYLISFMQHAGTSASQVWVTRANAIADGPIARVELPQRVPLGFHACWASGESL